MILPAGCSFGGLHALPLARLIGIPLVVIGDSDWGGAVDAPSLRMKGRSLY